MTTSTCEKKLDVYRRWGLSQESAFVRNPWFMSLSEEKITAVMDLFVTQFLLNCSKGFVIAISSF
jgi:mTERF domain-containing protein